MVRPETIIRGGLPGGYFSPVVSAEEFEEHILHCLDVMTHQPNFVLGVANQLVPGSSWERIRRVRELVDQYGNF